MGLNKSNLYVSSMIGTLETEIMTAFQTAAVRVGSGAADAAMTRWFGDTSPETKTYVETALTRMRTNLNCQQIDVAFASIKTVNILDATGKVTGTTIGRQGNNAAAAASPTGLLPVNSKLPTYSGVGFAHSNMWLDEGFSRLPTYLPLVANAVDERGLQQSKFNTLVHELSHLLLGTVDCVDDKGNTMYGTYQAQELARNGLSYVPATGYTPPFAALYNAENWGIFVEAAGRNKGT